MSRYWQVDVFAARRGGGNPLGVVLDAEGWDTRRMQAFAACTDLVETTFVLPPDDPAASYRVRIFTPDREIPMPGTRRSAPPSRCWSAAAAGAAPRSHRR